MKKTARLILTTLIVIFFSQISIAQTCADISLKKGTVITMTNQMFQRDYAAMKIYLKLSKKEQAEADETFPQDVESGKIVLPKSEIVSTIADVTIDNGVTTYYADNLIRGTIYKTKTFCKNGILTIAPYKDETIIQVATGKGDSITSTTYSGYNKIPLNIKVGDTLPTYQDLTFTSPYHTEYSGWSKHRETEANGDVYEISTPTTNTIDITTSTVTKYTNREVLGTEDITVNGVTYKTYKINTELWTKSTQKTKASALGVTLMAPVMQKLIDKGTHKSLGTNSDGYVVSSYVDWFAPTLGISIKRDIYDYKGNLFAKLTLKDIK